MTVDREALIEAAKEAVFEEEGPECTDDDGAEATGWAVLRALAPLIADAIETKRAEHFAEYGNEETGPRNYDWALTHAADLVRSLGGGQ